MRDADNLSNLQELTYDDDFIENAYDVSQSYLLALVKKNEYSDVQEVWKVTCLTSVKSIHYIVLYKNGQHICTCLFLVSHELVC